MKLWKKVLPLGLVIVLALAIIVVRAKAQNQDTTINVNVYSEGAIEVKLVRSSLFGYDTHFSISELYEADTVYLQIWNRAPTIQRVFWHSNVNKTFCYIHGIFFATTERIADTYGNIWRSYNGGYFSQSSEWFESLPTAGWMIWPAGYDGEIRIQENECLNAHFTVQLIQPTEKSETFALTFSAY